MENHDWLTISAASLEEAELIGIARLGALREEVEIQVVDEGKKGFLGLGSRPAVIRIRRLVPLMSSGSVSSGQGALPPTPERAGAPSAPTRAATEAAPRREEKSARQDTDTALRREPKEARQDADAASLREEKGARQDAEAAPHREEDAAPQRAEAAPPHEEKPAQTGVKPSSHRKAQPVPAAEAAPRGKETPTAEKGDKPQSARRRKKKVARETKPRRDVAEALLAGAAPDAAPVIASAPASELDLIILEEAQKLLAGFKVQMSLSAEEDEPGTRVLSLRGRDARSLVGRDAHVMEAVQHLLRLLVERRMPDAPDVVVDADGYWERHDRKLRELARRVADEVARTGRPVRLRPMPARDRRVIHVTLREDARVSTESHGSGAQRAVVISPQDKA